MYVVKWRSKQWAVIQTFGLFTGKMYQLYENIGGDQWERRPKNGITLYKTVKAAREQAQKLSQPSATDHAPPQAQQEGSKEEAQR